MLEAWDGRSIGSGVALILDECRKLNLLDPWAIAQLMLNGHDYEKLLGWAKQTDGAAIASLIGRSDRMALPPPAADLFPPIEACVGLLLLALVQRVRAQRRVDLGSLAGDRGPNRTHAARRGSLYRARRSDICVEERAALCIAAFRDAGWRLH